MQKRSCLNSAFVNPRALVVLLVCAAACLILGGTLLGFGRSRASANVFQRMLTFEERVDYQRAIEEVYWRHRIWPRERPDLKPPLDAVMSQAQLENKVADYQRKSQALEVSWHRPITAEQLQAEMDRMAKHTRQPEMLRELFGALGNDPFVIAECLARPLLAEHLLQSTQCSSEANERASQSHSSYNADVTTFIGYALPVITPEWDAEGACIDDTWTATTLINAPSGRASHTVVWTGSEMIIWGGVTPMDSNTGGRYDPITDSWTATSVINVPSARSFHTAVWTGTEMIIWGGEAGGGGPFNTGGRYNPVTDTWVSTSTSTAPSPRSIHTAVWTGSEMIVWGGRNASLARLNTGGRYDPETDTWVPTTTANAPSARESHTAVWTGTEMIVWGGGAPLNSVNTGGRYSPGTNSWLATSVISASAARRWHPGVV